MTMRKSGWYRVRPSYSGRNQLAYWNIGNSWVVISSGCSFHDDDMAEIDERMIMTPEGDLVYHSAEHDPAYNTQ